MFTSIDRFVLSKVEKFTQFMQRQFDIKLTSLINLAGGLILITFFMKWYFTGSTTGIMLIFEIFLTLSILTYVFGLSAIHQHLLDKWAMDRVSNPLKSDLIFKIMRTVFLLECTFYTAIIYFTTKEAMAEFPEGVFYLALTPTFLTFIYAVAVDALPPNTKKEEGWLKNLFRKLSPTT